jgi:RHH-type rel operon transcriptional repressor/antitoxin RelB
MKQISIRLDDDIVQELDKLAKETGRSKTFYVKQAILEQFEDLKDYFLAKKELENIKQGVDTPIPYKQIREELLA